MPSIATISAMSLIAAATRLYSAASFRIPSAFTIASAPRGITNRSPPPAGGAASFTAVNGLFDGWGGDESKPAVEIPPKLRDEIIKAEANTPAAKDRQQRIVVYFLLTITGITLAFFNAFLSDLRFGDGSPSEDLSYYGFGWVQENFVTSFLFMNKIGGALGLLGAGLSGTLAEVEIRSKKEAIEKIWAEMLRRQSLRERPTSSSSSSSSSSSGGKKKRRSTTAQSPSPSRKDMTGRQKKRLSALEELLDEGQPAMPPPRDDGAGGEGERMGDVATADGTGDESREVVRDESSNSDEILGAIAGFYKRADSMAASQALLLNKELEDRGILEKITDETGLKLVGKDAASKRRRDQGGSE